jgi:hypothetical protein
MQRFCKGLPELPLKGDVASVPGNERSLFGAANHRLVVPLVSGTPNERFEAADVAGEIWRLHGTSMS